MATKYVDLEALKHYNEKAKETFVKKELKTDSEDQYKVLSDNNLTDELVQKIHNAGDSGFNGQYDSLKNKPKINGVEIGENTTLTELDVVEGKIEDGDTGVASIKNDKTGGVMSYKPSEGKSGLVAVDSGSNSAAKAKVMMRVIDEAYTGVNVFGTDEGFYYRKGTGLAVDPQEEIVVKKDIANLATSESIEQTYAKSAKVTEDIATAKQEAVEEATAEAKKLVTGAFVYKGSSLFASLPTPSADNVGHVYNVTDQFITDDKFDVQSQTYPAGTNVVIYDAGGESYKYDVFTGFIDTSTFMLKTDVESVSNDEIDQLFSE